MRALCACTQLNNVQIENWLATEGRSKQAFHIAGMVYPPGRTLSVSRSGCTERWGQVSAVEAGWAAQVEAEASGWVVERAQARHTSRHSWGP